MTRTTSFGGLFEVFGTIGGAYLLESRSSGDSDLYNAYSTVKDASTCAE